MAKKLLTICDINIKPRRGHEPVIKGGYMVLMASLLIELQWKPEDLWIGLFHRTSDSGNSMKYREAWLCLLPCLPIYIRAKALVKRDMISEALSGRDNTINRTSGN